MGPYLQQDPEPAASLDPGHSLSLALLLLPEAFLFANMCEA